MVVRLNVQGFLKGCQHVSDEDRKALALENEFNHISAMQLPQNKLSRRLCAVTSRSLILPRKFFVEYPLPISSF
jgi:hypothetical protein